MQPNIIFKTATYIILTILGIATASAADVTSTDQKPLRTEIKASLAPTAKVTEHAAQTVGNAIAAEILASGLKTEILQRRMKAPSKPSKIAALKPTDTPAASGQADQT